MPDSVRNNCAGALSVKKERLILVLFAIYIIGAHLRLSLHSGGTVFVPMFLMVFSALSIAAVFAPALWSRIGVIILAISSFFFIQPWLGAEVYNSSAVIRNVLQIIISITGAAAVLYGLSKVDPTKIRKVVLILWAIFIILAVIEVNFLKGVFDGVRDLLYSGSGRGIYASVDRDVSIYGRIRATAFASEPSFLSDTLSALFVMVFMLTRKIGAWRPWALLTVMTFVSFMVVPSFKMAFYVLALAVWAFWPRTLPKFLLHLLVIFAFGCVFLVSSDSFITLLVGVGDGHMDTGSFFGRIGSAHIVGFEALSRFPIFGFGLGNRDAIYPVIVNVWNNSGAFSRFPWYSDGTAESLLSNGFWWMWIYLGVLGGVFFLWLTSRILHGVGVDSPWRSMTCAAIVWYAGSAFVDPQSWFVVVVFSIGALKFATEQDQNVKNLNSDTE